MADTRTPAQRSKIMRAVGTRNTGPELTVRKLLHRLGYRYRLNVRGLPGTPDIVFAGRKKVIFVHGCYWHGHNCKKGALPKSSVDYWGPKIQANRDRDARNVADLTQAGWSVLTVWQCELRDLSAVEETLSSFLGQSAKFRSTC
ncbi:very short patch repair endonuclease [Burkholderia sp. BE17]|uniref:very short patch repair endonuclease n=1 Tax=Burkholderia sp. BE17 TaxID=2656644 RepID=UPI00128B4A6A|nr:very short patch repair endonuclease [Burkholderia sp. BE17]MPV69064.1 DNA mismatch endonuclease Vsr [Burkholderia sp. BE17]